MTSFRQDDSFRSDQTYNTYVVPFSSVVPAFQELSYQWRTSLYLAASASAEFFADIMLAPMEATKVRIQTSPTAPPTLRTCAPFILRTEGLSGFYKVRPPTSFTNSNCVLSVSLAETV